jgi:hypothetical protein
MHKYTAAPSVSRGRSQDWYTAKTTRRARDNRAPTERAFVRAPDSTVECIDGLRTPGSGTVSVLGLDPAGDRGEPRLCLGAQPQDSQLPERLRVGETLKLYS